MLNCLGMGGGLLLFTTRGEEARRFGTLRVTKRPANGVGVKRDVIDIR